MSIKMQIAFGAINFFLFLALLYLMLKPIAREFFYARRERIKRNIAQSAWKLRRAKQHYKEAREEYDNLSNDVSLRKEAIAIDCEKECRSIKKDAEYHCDYLIMEARKVAADDMKESSDMINRKLVREAVRRAMKKLSTDEYAKTNRTTIERGLDDLRIEISGGKLVENIIDSKGEVFIQ